MSDFMRTLCTSSTSRTMPASQGVPSLRASRDVYKRQALRILNDTTKNHRTKICLVLFGAPAGILIPDTLIKRAHRAEHSDFRNFEFSLFVCCLLYTSRCV